jgi:hypothetical protein
MSAFKSLVGIFSQASSFNGLAGLALLLGVSEPLFQSYALAAAGVFSFVGILIKEGAPNA